MPRAKATETKSAKKTTTTRKPAAKKSTTTRKPAAKKTTAAKKTAAPVSKTVVTNEMIATLPENTHGYIIGEIPYLYAVMTSKRNLDFEVYRYNTEDNTFRSLRKYASNLDHAMHIVRTDAVRIRPANYPKRERLFVGCDEICKHVDTLAKKLAKVAVAEN